MIKQFTLNPIRKSQTSIQRMREEMQRELGEAKAPAAQDDGNDFVVVHDAKPVLAKKKGTQCIPVVYLPRGSSMHARIYECKLHVFTVMSALLLQGSATFCVQHPTIYNR